MGGGGKVGLGREAESYAASGLMAAAVGAMPGRADGAPPKAISYRTNVPATTTPIGMAFSPGAHHHQHRTDNDRGPKYLEQAWAEVHVIQCRISHAAEVNRT